ncbi:hypothetical protein KSS87_008593 [Heliosperma pusillum]|nr:hypothetical protein KSS87_008593 [Heliosperma pusillum]
MVYHSSFVDEEGITKACGCPLLPLKSHIKGPAPVSDQGSADIVDETITFFRANVFFRNFDIKSSADKLLIYLTYYINVALKRIEGCRTLAEGTKAIINLGLEDVPVPGESGFPFPGLFSPPKSRQEAGHATSPLHSHAYFRVKYESSPKILKFKILKCNDQSESGTTVLLGLRLTISTKVMVFKLFKAIVQMVVAEGGKR